MRDTSLRLPPGVSGTIVEVRVFSRRGVDKDERALAIERAEIERLAKDRDDERAILERSFAARLKELMLGQTAVGGPRGMKSGTEITEEVLAEYHAGAVAADLDPRRHEDGGYRGPEEADGRRRRGARPRASRARSKSCSAATSCRPA